ncbi:MAG: hypothetical protein ACYS5V_03055 [Planctomycetota bacterium]|jgi:hypothetical protein
MRQEVRAYIEDAVIPLIVREHPEAAAEMSIRVEGSAGLGRNDEWSDLEATVYLPRKAWQQHGGQLQLALIHSLERFSPHSTPNCEFPCDPYSWHVFGHPEINVHPWSELLCGQAEAVLAGERDVPWEEVAIEDLFALQRYPIARDAGGVLTRLKEATTTDRYPKTLLGTHLPDLLRVAFLSNRQCYPFRKYLLPFLQELPGVPPGLLDEFEVIRSSQDWQRKSEAVSNIVRILTEQILADGRLTSEMLEYLFEAKGGRAWENPDWWREPERNRARANAAGYDELDGWIWGWWGLGDGQAGPGGPADADAPGP